MHQDPINGITLLPLLPWLIHLRLPTSLYWIPALIFGLCLGELIEIIQPYVNRFGDIKDFQADALGVLFGIFLGTLVYQVKSRSVNSINVDPVKKKIREIG